MTNQPNSKTIVFHKKEIISTEKRKVLLVVLPYLYRPTNTPTKPNKTVRSFLAYPYGVITIASYLKKNCTNQPDIQILDLNISNSISIEDNFVDFISKFNPDIIGYSQSYDISFTWLKKLSKIAKLKYQNTIQVVGGPSAFSAYKEVLDGCLEIDAVCYSEGELGFKNLIHSTNYHLSLDKAPWITRSNLLNPLYKPETLYEDLNKTIDIDYSLVDINAYSMKEAFSPFSKFQDNAKQFFLVTSRGCPFKCVFCAEPSFHGSNMRYVEVDKVIDHVELLVKEYGLNVLTIYDDQILMNKDRAKELFKKLAKFNIRIEMPNGVTMSYIDEEMAFLMRRAGVDTIFLAIESGVKRVLHEIIKKPLAFDRVKPTIQLLHNNDIFVGSFFVIGLPGETKNERLANKDFILDVGIDWAFFNYATPLRGSELFKNCISNNWIEQKYLELGAIDMTDYIINAPGMDPISIKEDMLHMNLDVNFVNNRRFRIGDFKTARSSFEEVISRHPGQPFAHYFLVKTLEKLEPESKQIDLSRAAYKEIITKDLEWYKLCQIFNLNTFGVLNESA